MDSNEIKLNRMCFSDTIGASTIRQSDLGLATILKTPSFLIPFFGVEVASDA